jgi:hypothetical protein
MDWHWRFPLAQERATAAWMPRRQKAVARGEVTPQAMFIRRYGAASFHKLEQRLEETSFNVVLTDFRNV